MFETFITNFRGDLLKHLSAPLLQERRSYLEYLHENGSTTTTLRYYAMAMLHFVNISGIKSKKVLTDSEVEQVVDVYMGWRPNVKHQETKRSSFHYRIRRWLLHFDMLEVVKEDYYGKSQIDSFCGYLLDVKGYSPRTIETTQERLKSFFAFCEEEKCYLENISPLLLDKYFSVKSKTLSRRTITSVASVLREFFKYCAEQESCNKNLWKTIKAPRTYKQETIPSYVPWERVVNIVNRISQRRDPASIRNYAIMLLFVVYGLRDSEVTNLRLSDIDWEKDIINIRRAKSYRKQELPLMDIVGNAILRYIKEVRPNEYNHDVLFLRMKAPIEPLRGAYTIVREYLKEEGVDVKHYGAHSLRHSCATFLINHGHSYKLVADILGHQQYNTVNVYAKVDLNNLRKVADINWEELL